MSYNYENTEYPNIYENTYWGYFRFEETRPGGNKILFENRNKFIKDYNIIKYKGHLPLYAIKETLFNGMYDCLFRQSELNNRPNIYQDHLEFYETKQTFIVLFSNYGGVPNEEYLEDAKKEGFIQLDYPLYTTDAITMYKEVLKKKYR